MNSNKVKVRSLGLIPLPLVILPKECSRLHIYQSQFKALVNDCFASGKDFVVPFMYKGKPTNLGTSVKLVDVERFYPDGKMDIKVEGHEVVKISNISDTKNITYQIGEVEPMESALPEIYSEELNNLFNEFQNFNGLSVFDNEISLYEIARNIKLDKDTKVKLISNASNPVVQSKIILNELRMAVLTLRLQDQAGFRYYMN